MIDLRITMVSGKSYKIKNVFAEDTNHFIRAVLTKSGTQLNWYEVIQDVFIQVSQIQSVEKLREVIEEDDTPMFQDGDEIVLPENMNDKR